MKILKVFGFFLSRSFHISPFLFSTEASRPFHTLPQRFSNLRYAKDFCELVRSLSKNPRDSRVLAVLDSMLTKTHLLDSTTSILVLRGLSQSKKLNRAKAVLSNLKKKGNIPETFLYSLVLQCLVRDGRIQDVESVWKELSEPSDRVINASDFVIYLCRHGEDVAEIERVYQRVSSSGWDLNREGYMALIGAMCRKDNPNPVLARTVLREMEEKGFEGGELTYFALFQSFCRTGNISEADSVLRNLVEREKNYKLDISVYGNFLYGLCKSGKLREARKLFDKLLKKDRRSPVNQALKLGRRVIFQLSHSSTVSKTMAFEAYFRSLCSTGFLEEAERLLKEEMRKNTVPEICVYKSFIEALFRAGRTHDAIRFFEAEKKKGHVSADDIAVSVVMGLCKTGKVDDAYRLLCETMNGGFVPTSLVWNRILQSYWDGGRLEEVMGLFEGIRTGSCSGCSRPDASTYDLMIHGLLGEGDIGVATSLFEEMVKEKLIVSSALCSAVVRGLCGCGKFEEAHHYLNELIENGILISYVGWELVFHSFCVGSCEDLKF